MYDLPNVLEALSAIYDPNPNNNTQHTRSSANQYLTTFQQSPTAWSIAHDLLSTQTNPTILFFAAQTLHSKCLTDVHQLSPHDLDNLNSSLGQLWNTSEGAIATRLGMALCVLAIQKGDFTFLPSILSQAKEKEQVLELVRVLPEEVSSPRLLLSREEDLYHFQSHLIQQSDGVLSLLEGIVTQQGVGGGGGGGGVELGLKCCFAWIAEVAIPPQVLLQHLSLIQYTIQILHVGEGGQIQNQAVTSELYDIATDVTCQLIQCYPSTATSHHVLIDTLLPLLLSLNSGPTSPFAQALHTQNTDVLRAHCRIYTEMGESYLSLLLSPQPNAHSSTLLSTIVTCCSSINELEVAILPLHFWYRFVTWLEDLEPYEYRQYHVDSYTSQLIPLIGACRKMVCYPVDWEDLVEDQREDVVRDRMYVLETMEDLCRLLGGTLVLHHIGQGIQEECTRVASLPPEEQLEEWRGMESCLVAVTATAKYIARDEGEVLPHVMALIPTLPQSVPMLRATANKLIGVYAAWLDGHPSHLQPLLPYLAQSLNHVDCASSAAVAIKELCECCSTKFSLGESVLSLYDGIVAASSAVAGQPGQGQEVLGLKDELEVLEGACKAVSRQMQELASNGTSTASTDQYISRLVQPIGERLATFAAPTSTVGIKLVLSDIERLTVVVRFLKVPNTSANVTARSQFLIDLMTQCWPLLDALSQKFVKDVNLAEKLCRLHKHVLRECGAGPYKPILDHLRAQLVRNYAASHSSPYLYAASVCIVEYANDPTCLDRLYDTFSELSNATFGLLQHHENFVSHPDVVEELFFLADRMVSRCPTHFLRSPLLHSYVQCASVAMKLDHRDANRGTLTFIESVLGYGIELQAVPKADDACKGTLEKVISTEGEHVVRNLILSLRGELPCYRITSNSGSIAGILFKLKTLCPSLLQTWAQNSFASSNDNVKSVFLEAISNLCSREEFFESMRRYESICTRNRRMGGK